MGLMPTLKLHRQRWQTKVRIPKAVRDHYEGREFLYRHFATSDRGAAQREANLWEGHLRIEWAAMTQKGALPAQALRDVYERLRAAGTSGEFELHADEDMDTVEAGIRYELDKMDDAIGQRDLTGIEQARVAALQDALNLPSPSVHHWHRGVPSGSLRSILRSVRGWGCSSPTHIEIAAALAPVDHEGRQMIDARGLHKWLKVKTPFNDWIRRRVTEYAFEDGSDYYAVLRLRSDGKGGRRSRHHLLTIDMAKELAMVERTDVGRATRRYFIQMEQAAVKMAADHVAKGMNAPQPPAGLGVRAGALPPTFPKAGCISSSCDPIRRMPGLSGSDPDPSSTVRYSRFQLVLHQRERVVSFNDARGRGLCWPLSKMGRRRRPSGHPQDRRLPAERSGP